MQEYTFEYRDEFQRKSIAEKLINLISKGADISPMVIDGDWGVGKTEFCKKLIHLIQEQKPDEYQTVYIDAFRSDHNDEPLIAILAEIIKEFTVDDNGEQTERTKNLIKRIGKIINFSLGTVTKAVLGHLLKQNVDDVTEGFSNAWSDDDKKEINGLVSDTAIELSNKAVDSSMDLIAEKLLKEQIESEKNLQALKDILLELSQEKPIILFIDELDRCRPDYAVQMLEILKHIFDIENVKIVLITNMQQLQASVNHRYGSLVQSERYLNKFIKFSFKLPNVVDDWGGYGNYARNVSSEYFKILVQKSVIGQVIKFTRDANILNNFIVDIIEKNNLSLREVETFVRYLDIYFLLQEDDYGDILYYLGYRLIEFLGVFIFCFRPRLINHIINNELNIIDLIQSIGFNNPLKMEIGDRKYYAMRLTIFMLSKNSKYSSEELVFENPEDIEFWEKRVESSFGAFNMPDDYLGIIKNVIYELQFKKLKH